MKKVILTVLAAGGCAVALTVAEWLNVNGSNQFTYLRQYEDGKRWTWDIFQTEVWAWRFSGGLEAEFDHPRKPVYESLIYEDIEGNRLAQRYVRYRDNIFDVRAGTYDKTLGKGLTLRSYEDRDFGVFQRLEGGVADISATFGGRDWGGITALWGVNKRDEEEQDKNDRVAAGQLVIRPVDWFYLTGSYVQAEVEDLNVTVPPRPVYDETLYGVGGGGAWTYFDLYAEYANREGQSFSFSEERPGHGFYGGGNIYPPRSSISIEYKSYYDLTFPYNNPPPASYDSRMISAAGGLVSGSPYERGYFAQATTNPAAALRLRGGYSYANDKWDRYSEKHQEIEEGFGFCRYDFQYPVSVEVGYEHIEHVYFILGGKTGDMRRRPVATVSWTPWDDHSFSTHFERERRLDYTVEEGNYIDNRASIGYNYSSWLGVTLDYEDSTEKVREFVSPGDPNDPFDDVYRFKNNWLWGEVRLSWYTKTFRNHVVSVGYGSQRGGVVCSSGVCRIQAPFSGLKVAVESSF